MTRLAILMYHRVEAVPHGATHPKNFVTATRLTEQVDGLLSSGYSPVTFAQRTSPSWSASPWRR